MLNIQVLVGKIIGTQVSIMGKGLACKSQGPGSNPTTNHPSPFFFPRMGKKEGEGWFVET